MKNKGQEPKAESQSHVSERPAKQRVDGEVQRERAASVHRGWTRRANSPRDTRSPTRHAQLLVQAKAAGDDHLHQFLNDLQRKYGNRHLQSVLDIGRKEGAEMEFQPRAYESINRERGSAQALDQDRLRQMKSAHWAKQEVYRPSPGGEKQERQEAEPKLAPRQADNEEEEPVQSEASLLETQPPTKQEAAEEGQAKVTYAQPYRQEEGQKQEPIEAKLGDHSVRSLAWKRKDERPRRHLADNSRQPEGKLNRNTSKTIISQASNIAVQRIPTESSDIRDLRVVLQAGYEDIAIKIMGRLSKEDVTRVISSSEFKEQAISTFDNEEMYRAIKAMEADLYQSLVWMFEEGTDWEKLHDVISHAPSGRSRILADNWMKEQFVKELNDEEMAEAVKVLDGSLLQKLTWMKAKGSNWSLVKEKIDATTNDVQKLALYGSSAMKEFFQDICNDQEMEKAVQLLGGTLSQKLAWVKRTPSEVLAEDSSPKDKAAWIERLMAGVMWGGSSEIVRVFKSSGSGSQFLAIQEYLDMSAVMDYLELWDAVQVGAIGPVVAGAGKLNTKRTEYILEATQDYGPALGEVFIHYIFRTMHTDDMEEVLRLLADNKRLGQTILMMDTVKEIIKKRGVDIGEYKDRDESLKYVGRGILETLGGLLETSEAARGNKATKVYSERADLPEEYQKFFDSVYDAIITEQLSPEKAILSALDYAAFNIPSGIYSLGAGVVGGIEDIAKGEYEEAARKLTGPALLLVSYVGVKAYRTRRTNKSTVEGPGREFVIKGHKGPIHPDVARLGSIVALNPEAQAATGLLIHGIGEKGLIAVARYVRDNSKAAIFVHKHGVPAIKALDRAIREAGGDFAKAQAMLPRKPAGLLTSGKAGKFKAKGKSPEGEPPRPLKGGPERRKLLPPGRTSDYYRNRPGTAYGGHNLPYVKGRWLRGQRGNLGHIPKQIADKLRGRRFRDFKHFREEFWQLVAADKKLAKQFRRSNRALMRRGEAPYATRSERTGRGRPQIKYNLDHLKDIDKGGGVYDLSNIKVRTPLSHRYK